MTISLCLVAIANHVTTHQAELDAAAIEARAAHVAALRLALQDYGEDASPELILICETVAADVRVGRDDDDYPQVSMSDACRAMCVTALRAGVLTYTTGSPHRYVQIGAVSWYDGFDGCNEIPAHNADYRAWDAAQTYRAKNART